MIKQILSVLTALVMSLSISAQLKLPAILSDNMVVQQGKPISLWGWAGPGKTVSTAFRGKKYTAVADEKGNWQIKLPASKAGYGGDIKIESAGQQVVIENILIGEVWVCSGQSNMEYELNAFKDFYAEDIHKSANDHIRFVTLQNSINNMEAADAPLKVNWSAITKENVTKCSAVAYFFARKLQDRLQIPVGIIITAWGGTPAQAWIDTAAVKQFSNYASVYDQSIRKLDLSHLAQLKQEAERMFVAKRTEEALKLKPATLVDFDDSQWENAVLPGAWESNGHPDFDGIAAYRISFSVSAEDAGKEATLHLPAIDDIDSTYINGVFIGTHTVWNELRTYNVPANVLKPGKNILTIWVEDDQGGGGLNADADNYYVQTLSGRIALKGPAKLKMLTPLQSPLPGVNLSGLQNSPTVLFNGMIAPLLPLSIKGVIWYQGESNVPQYEEYRSLFPALITNWRQRWKQGDFPFLFVQLSSYNPAGAEPVLSDWAFLREAQSMTRKLPNTGMAVSTDVGDKKDIHPKQKKEVGERLAACAFKIAYAQRTVIAEGPAFAKATVSKNTISLLFKNTGSGLAAKGGELKGFMLAGADKQFYPAKAKISGNMVILESDKVFQPLYVRYAWANAPLDANLYNKEGFPAEPFRTDQ